MSMLAIQDGAVKLWATRTDTYTSTKTEKIYASVWSIAPVPEDACDNAKSFEISGYNIEPTLLDTIVFKGQPVPYKFANVAHPTQGRFGRIANTQVLVDLLTASGKPMAPTAQAPACPQVQAQAPYPTQQPQGQDKQDKSPDAKA